MVEEEEAIPAVPKRWCYITYANGALKDRTLLMGLTYGLDEWMKGNAKRVIFSTGTHNVDLYAGQTIVKEAVLWKGK
jgi:hypothetical protein